MSVTLGWARLEPPVSSNICNRSVEWSGVKAPICNRGGGDRDRAHRVWSSRIGSYRGDLKTRRNITSAIRRAQLTVYLLNPCSFEMSRVKLFKLLLAEQEIPRCKIFSWIPRRENYKLSPIHLDKKKALITDFVISSLGTLLLWKTIFAMVLYWISDGVGINSGDTYKRNATGETAARIFSSVASTFTSISSYTSVLCCVIRKIRCNFIDSGEQYE